jgi:hypothetical protein
METWRLVRAVPTQRSIAPPHEMCDIQEKATWVTDPNCTNTMKMVMPSVEVLWIMVQSIFR